LSGKPGKPEGIARWENSEQKGEFPDKFRPKLTIGLKLASLDTCDLQLERLLVFWAIRGRLFFGQA
jgi:hypothetical protein